MNQHEYFGFGSIKNLKTILDEGNQRNIFLVSGGKSYKSSGAEQELSKILAPYTITRFYNFSPNPKLEDVEKGIDVFKREEQDLVIAVGGGSVIDMAKLINSLSAQPGNPEDYAIGKKIESMGNPLIAIPTTSGAGSEATHFAVVYINKAKFSLAHEYILPDISIVDPQFTMNLPRNVTASSGMDALGQATESYWGKGATKESKAYAAEAIRLVMERLENAVNNSSIAPRHAMAKAAHLAGKAINITKTTAPHALSYAFTSYYGVPHGHAVGLTLGRFLVYNSQGNNFSGLYDLFGVDNANAAKEKIELLMKNIGLETDLKTWLKTDKDIDLIVNNVNVERLGNNPRLPTKEDIRKIITI